MPATDIALAYLKAFSTGDADAVAAYVTEDFENNQMGTLGACFKGRSLYRERLSGFLSKFRQLNYTPEDIIANGNKVVVAYRMTANDNQCALDIRGVMIITVTADKVSRRDDYWDGLSYLAQTGLARS